MNIGIMLKTLEKLKTQYHLNENTEIVISKGNNIHKHFTITAWLNNSKICIDLNVPIQNDETTIEENV